MTRAARAVISIVESFPEATQRDILKALVRKFDDVISEEEDRPLLAKARAELAKFKNGRGKVIPAAKVRAHLEREGIL